MKTKNTGEPILVQDPVSKQQYNVGPLIGFLQMQFQGNCHELSETMADYLVNISMMLNDDNMELDEFRDMMFTLNSLRDALKAMDQVPIAAPVNGQPTETGKEVHHGR